MGVQHRRGAQRGQGFAEYAFILTLIAMVVLSVVSVVGKHTKQSLEPLPVALTPGSTYSSSARYWIPPSNGSACNFGNFFPQGEFPNGVWQSPPGNCNNWDPTQAVLSAKMQPYADNGYSALALSGSYGEACDYQNVVLPASVSPGSTFTLQFDVKTEGPLSAGPAVGVWDSAFNFWPTTWSTPLANASSQWRTIVGIVHVPAGYVAGDGCQLKLYSNETNGGPPAVNAYANIQMFPW